MSRGCQLVILLLLVGITRIHAQVINSGVGGNNTKDLLTRLDSGVLVHRPDLVILMVGTNDLLNSRKMVSFQQYESNLDQIVKTIKSSGAEVIILSPPPVDTVYLFERHDRKLFDQSPNVKLDTARHITNRVATRNKAMHIDLFQKFSVMNLPNHNEDLFFRNEKNSGKHDGVHPTGLGYQFIAETVFYYLKENSLLEKKMKIVCYGDSITFGAGVAPKKPYPSVLQSLMDGYFKE